MECFCMGCGTPGAEWCSKCEDEHPGDGPDGTDFYDLYARAVVTNDGPFTKVLEEYCTQCGQQVDARCGCPRGHAKANKIFETTKRLTPDMSPLPPDCDCKSPAPVRGKGYGAWLGLECAGCRGKVSQYRIIEERITVRES